MNANYNELIQITRFRVSYFFGNAGVFKGHSAIVSQWRKKAKPF